MTEDDQSRRPLWTVGVIAAALPVGMVVMGGLADLKTLVDAMGWSGIVALIAAVVTAVGFVVQVQEPRSRWNGARLTATSFLLLVSLVIFSVRIAPFYSEGSPSAADVNEPAATSPDATSSAVTSTSTASAGVDDAGPPVVVTVDPLRGGLEFVSETVIEATTAEMLDPMFSEIFLAKGGLFANRLTVTLGLEGRRDRQARITNVRPVILKRQEPPRGSILVIFSSGPGKNEILEFDLDTLTPEALLPTTTPGARPTPYFGERNIILAKGEVVTTTLNFHARRTHVEFDIEIDVVVGEERETLRVTNNGKSFAVAGCRQVLSDYAAVYASEPGPALRLDPSNLPDVFSMFGQDPCNAYQSAPPDVSTTVPAPETR